jgi:hypothetical protein
MPLFKRPVETIVKSGGMPATGDITLIENGNVTISQNAGSFSFSAGGGVGGGLGGIAGSNTTYTSGTVTITGVGGGITVSSNTGQRIDLSVAAPVAQSGQTQNLIDLTLSGNTAGVMALMSSGTVTLAGGNNITLSQAGNAVTISGANLGTLWSSATTGSRVESVNLVGANNSRVALEAHQHAGLWAVDLAGNTAGNTSSGAGSFRLAGGPNITLSGSTAAGGQTISISAPAPGGGAAPTLSVWNNAAGVTLGSTATSNGTFWLFPLDPDDQIFPGNMTVSTAYIAVSASSNISNAYSHTMNLGIYTINGVSLSLLNTVQHTVAFAANANNSQAISGARFLTLASSAWSASPTFSQTKYYVGLQFNTSGTHVNLSFVGQRYLQSSQRSGTFGNSITSGNTSMGWTPWIGVSGASRNNTTALPTTIELSQLSKGGNLYAFLPYILFNDVSSNF